MPTIEIRAAVLAARAYQNDPTTAGLRTMQDAIDRAIEAGATRDQIAAVVRQGDAR